MRTFKNASETTLNGDIFTEKRKTTLTGGLLGFEKGKHKFETLNSLYFVSTTTPLARGDFA